MNKNFSKIGVGIIGCGGIGLKRAKNLPENMELVGYFDVNKENASSFDSQFDGKNFKSLDELIHDKNINVLFVATSHDALCEIGLKGIKHNKHIFLEKPGGRNLKELLNLKNMALQNNVKIGVGFNHRFHRGIIKAKDLIDKKHIGNLIYIRARYGHGGRLGYEKEWRANPILSGGGELIDQGSHIIDLSRFFLGDFIKLQSLLGTFFWDMDVDDNAFMILKSKDDKVAFLHASCTEWKNLFSFEIFGKLGKIEINGLGGSYGVEKLTLYKMLPEMGPPKVESWEYLTPDDSWSEEMVHFNNLINEKQNCLATIEDAIKSMEIVEKIHKENNYDYSS